MNIDWATDGMFTDAIVDLAMSNRWAVHRPRRILTRGHVGFPGLMLARRGVILFRVVKTEKGKLSSEQLAWGRQLEPEWMRELALGDRRVMRFDVWRPADWEPLIISTLTMGDRPRAVNHVEINVRSMTSTTAAETATKIMQTYGPGQARA